MLLKLFVLYFLSFGFIQIIVDASIFTMPRAWLKRNSIYFLHLPKMIFCVLCLGFWVGVCTSLYLYSPTKEAYIELYLENWQYAIADGFITSAVVWLLYTIQSRIETI